MESSKRRGGVSDLGKIQFEEVNHKGTTTTANNNKAHSVYYLDENHDTAGICNSLLLVVTQRRGFASPPVTVWLVFLVYCYYLPFVVVCSGAPDSH